MGWYEFISCRQLMELAIVLFLDHFFYHLINFFLAYCVFFWFVK